MSRRAVFELSDSGPIGVCRKTMPGFDLQMEPEISTEGEMGAMAGSGGSGATGSLSSAAGAGSTAGGSMVSAHVKGVSEVSESRALQATGRKERRQNATTKLTMLPTDLSRWMVSCR